MSYPVDPKRIAKLPKWARDYIEHLEREATDSKDSLDTVLDDQTVSKCRADLYVGNSFRDVYFNASESIHITHADVHLNVNFRQDDRIELHWRGHSHAMGDICFIPTSYQQARLVHPKNAYTR